MVIFSKDNLVMGGISYSCATFRLALRSIPYFIGRSSKVSLSFLENFMCFNSKRFWGRKPGACQKHFLVKEDFLLITPSTLHSLNVLYRPYTNHKKNFNCTLSVTKQADSSNIKGILRQKQ